jgi:dipeptide transport system substrate-binding protein
MRLLRRAGHKDGLTTVLTVERGVYDAALVEAVRTDLAAVGVRTRLETLSGGQYRRRMAKPESFAMTLVTWHASLPDPGEWVETMCGRDTARPGGTNLSHWSSARLEAQRARADALADPAARIAAYSAMQETIADGVPYVPLISSLQTSGCSRNVQGFYLHPLYVLDLASYWKR